MRQRLLNDPVLVRFSRETIARIDQERGTVPRAVWIRQQLEQAFKLSDEIAARHPPGTALSDEQIAAAAGTPTRGRRRPAASGYRGADAD